MPFQKSKGHLPLQIKQKATLAPSEKQESKVKQMVTFALSQKQKDKTHKADSDICLFRKERAKDSDIKQKKTKDFKAEEDVCPFEKVKVM